MNEILSSPASAGGAREGNPDPRATVLLDPLPAHCARAGDDTVQTTSHKRADTLEVTAALAKAGYNATAMTG